MVGEVGGPPGHGVDLAISVWIVELSVTFRCKIAGDKDCTAILH